MYLEKQVIAIDLAKRLKELGIKQESLFYWNLYGDGIKTWFELRYMEQNSTPVQFSAFTASELGFMMPYAYQKNGKTHFIETTAGYIEHEHCTVCSSHFYDNTHSSDAVVGDDFDGNGNEANARAQMLIHLIENKLIEKK